MSTSESRGWRFQSAVIAVAACATGADAAVVRFDNPTGAGHYYWAPQGTAGEGWLDIHRAAHAQPQQDAGPGSFGHTRSEYVTKLFAGGGGQYLTTDGLLVMSSAEGDVISSATAGQWTNGLFIHHPILGSNFAEGEEAFIGVRFDAGSGLQYGWIGVVRTGVTLDAFAWAYETEAGVPISVGPTTIPSPSTLSLLGVSALATHRRRRP